MATVVNGVTKPSNAGGRAGCLGALLIEPNHGYNALAGDHPFKLRMAAIICGVVCHTVLVHTPCA